MNQLLVFLFSVYIILGLLKLSCVTVVRGASGLGRGGRGEGGAEASTRYHYRYRYCTVTGCVIATITITSTRHSHVAVNFHCKKKGSTNKTHQLSG